MNENSSKKPLRDIVEILKQARRGELDAGQGRQATHDA